MVQKDEFKNHRVPGAVAVWPLLALGPQCPPWPKKAVSLGVSGPLPLISSQCPHSSCRQDPCRASASPAVTQRQDPHLAFPQAPVPSFLDILPVLG